MTVEEALVEVYYFLQDGCNDVTATARVGKEFVEVLGRIHNKTMIIQIKEKK